MLAVALVLVVALVARGDRPILDRGGRRAATGSLAARP
jgi:hypothetical protein